MKKGSRPARGIDSTGMQVELKVLPGLVREKAVRTMARTAGQSLVPHPRGYVGGSQSDLRPWTTDPLRSY